MNASEDPLRRSLNWLATIRVALLGAILLSAVLLQAGAGVALRIAFLDRLTAAALFISLFHWTAGRLLSSRLSAGIQLVADLLLVTALSYSSGGPDSVFNFLFLVVIGASAFLLNRTGTLAMATIAAILYATVVQSLASGLLPPPPLAPAAHWTAARVHYNLAVNVLAFYGVAFMASYLSQKLRAARAELELRQKAFQRLQDLYGNVIASMSSGLITTDLAERVTFLNRAGGEILGLDPTGASGRPLSELGFTLPSEWSSGGNRTLGREYRREVEIERNGTPRTVGFSVRTLMEPDAAGVLILFQDLTDIQRLEREARFNQQLAAVGAMAAGIAHEIRNPLASISGSVQVLSNELSIGPAERRLMEIIVSESNRLSKILEDFLRFVRPSERSVGVFDVAATVSEVMELFQLSDEVSHSHRIEIDVSPPSSLLSGDRDQIRQIVYNIAKNAVRAMSGGGTLTLVGREEDGWYSIRFSDTGRGMSEEERGRIFTPFSTAFDGGTGLGMAIVRRIVEDHGGSIDVESRPGEGTTMTILLPRGLARDKGVAAAAPAGLA